MIKNIIIIVINTIILTSCATIVEGEVDYARTVTSAANSISNKNICPKEAYINSTKAPAGTTRGCYEALYRKYTAVPEIKKGQTISVHIMQGFIKDAFESRRPQEFIQGHSANAEIVVIANVCEQGISGCSQKFGPSVDKKGRVIFFSNGVKAKQYLNFSYLPVYGPIKYRGGPLIIQLTIIELDNLSTQEVALISSLSAAGKKAYPPASSALSLLDTLGKSLLQGSQDDILFRYSMTLTPGTGSPDYQNPIVSAGNYAFVRKDTIKGRQEEEIWNKLMFDNLSGRLVTKCEDEDIYTTFENDEGETETIKNNYNPCTFNLTGNESVRDYRDNSYLTFQIQSGFTEASLDNLQTLEELITDLNLEKNKNASNIIDVTQKLGEELSRNTNENILMDLLVSIKKDINEPGYDQLAKLSIDVSSFIDRFSAISTIYKSECIDTPPPSPECLQLINKEQLSNVYFKTREYLTAISPFADIDTLLPSNLISSGAISSNNRKELITAFRDGYKFTYQKRTYSTYLGLISEIENLSKHIKRIQENTDTKSTYNLNKNKNYLNQSLENYFNRLSNDAALFKQAKCSDDANKKERCYRYPTSDQFSEIITITNNYITREDSNNEKLPSDITTNGLTANKIKSIISGIMD